MLCDCFKRELGHSRFLLLLFLLAVGRAHAEDTTEAALDNSVDHVFADIISDLNVVLPTPVSDTAQSGGRVANEATKPKLLDTVIVTPRESGEETLTPVVGIEPPVTTQPTGGDGNPPELRLAELNPAAARSQTTTSVPTTDTSTKVQVDATSDEVISGVTTDSQDDSAVEVEADLEIPSPPDAPGDQRDANSAIESPVPPEMNDGHEADVLGIDLTDSPSIDLTTEEVSPTLENTKPSVAETLTDQVETAKPPAVASDSTVSPESPNGDTQVSPTTPRRPVVVPRNVALMRRPIASKALSSSSFMVSSSSAESATSWGSSIRTPVRSISASTVESGNSRVS